MTDPKTDLSAERMPWLRSGFDLEGYVGAIAAWLVGILLGFIWSPLFWIGFAGAVVILLATRTAERTPPVNAGVLVAPTDGLVVSVGGAAPPDELLTHPQSYESPPNPLNQHYKQLIFERKLS